MADDDFLPERHFDLVPIEGDSSPMIRRQKERRVRCPHRLHFSRLASRRCHDIDKALVKLRDVHPDGVLVLADPVFLGHAGDIVAFISAQRLIAAYADRNFVQVGGLLSYGTNYRELFRKAAGYVDRILNGAKPGDLPVRQAERFELVLNLKAAKELGLEVPATLLALADEVIE